MNSQFSAKGGISSYIFRWINYTKSLTWQTILFKFSGIGKMTVGKIDFKFDLTSDIILNNTSKAAKSRAWIWGIIINTFSFCWSE